MSKDELFAGREFPERDGIAPGHEITKSPLGAYVLDVMPTDLAAVNSGELLLEDLADKQSRLIEAAASEITGNDDPEVASVTQLDLLFMFGSYIPAGDDMYRVAPPALNTLIAEQCTRFKALDPYMTYEQIIDTNAIDHGRTGRGRVYSNGPTGRNERDFYIGHHWSEPYIKETAFKLHGIVNHPDSNDITPALVRSQEQLELFTKYMGRYASLPNSDFAHFRKYLMSYADGTKNASGAFMPSVQMLELSLHAPTDMYGKYLDDSYQYFPKWSQPLIENWRQRSAAGENIENMLESGVIKLDSTGRSHLVKTIDKFVDFRMTHLGVTKRKIPEAFSSVERLTRRAILEQIVELEIVDTPGEKGTSGFDVRNLLANSSLRLLHLMKRIDPTAPEVLK